MGPDPVRFDETLHQRALANVRAFDRRSAAIDGHRPAAVAVVLLPDDAGRACFLLTPGGLPAHAHEPVGAAGRPREPRRDRAGRGAARAARRSRAGTG